MQYNTNMITHKAKNINNEMVKGQLLKLKTGTFIVDDSEIFHEIKQETLRKKIFTAMYYGFEWTKNMSDKGAAVFEGDIVMLITHEYGNYYEDEEKEIAKLGLSYHSRYHPFVVFDIDMCYTLKSNGDYVEFDYNNLNCLSYSSESIHTGLCFDDINGKSKKEIKKIILSLLKKRHEFGW